TGSTLAFVHLGDPGVPMTDPGLETAVCEEFLFTNERTVLLDPGFGLRQLVDIAIRALSPSVNDPTTAVQVVDRVVDLLGLVVDRPARAGWYLDDSAPARVRPPYRPIPSTSCRHSGSPRSSATAPTARRSCAGCGPRSTSSRHGCR